MAYMSTNSRGRSYILHSKEMTLKNGNAQTIYFFAKEKRESALDSLPTWTLQYHHTRWNMMKIPRTTHPINGLPWAPAAIDQAMPAEAVNDQMIFRFNMFLKLSREALLPISDSIPIPNNAAATILAMSTSMFSHPKNSRVCSGKKNSGIAREISMIK